MNMNDTDRTFYTATMANIQAEQGNLARAAVIYRYLLRRGPRREDLAEALAEIEAQLAEKDPYDLVEIVSRWAELVLMLGRAGDLARVRRRLRSR
jgi:hypothetical protein